MITKNNTVIVEDKMDTTESKIITATLEWIKHHDYRQLSMRKLATQIGMTTGALYQHFQNKNELFYQVSLTLSREVVDRLQIDGTLPAEEQLLAIASGLTQLSQEEPKLIDFLFFNPSLQEFYTHADARFAFYDQVMRLVQQVNPGKISDQQLFNQLWSFIQGYSLLIRNQVASYDPQLVALTLHEFIQEA